MSTILYYFLFSVHFFSIHPTLKRTKLYSKLGSEDEIYDINIELKELRSKLRICNNILEDAERIQIRYNRALELEEAERQNRYRNKNQIMR